MRLLHPTSVASLFLLLALLAVSPAAHAQPPVDADWKANAVVDELRTASDPKLGAAQGVSFRQNRLYFYAGKSRPAASFGTPRGTRGFTPEEDAEFMRMIQGHKK
jgi:hypothetical protein